LSVPYSHHSPCRDPSRSLRPCRDPSHSFTATESQLERVQSADVVVCVRCELSLSLSCDESHAGA
jgi:hypothetical protein